MSKISRATAEAIARTLTDRKFDSLVEDLDAREDALAHKALELVLQSHASWDAQLFTACPASWFRTTHVVYWRESPDNHHALELQFRKTGRVPVPDYAVGYFPVLDFPGLHRAARDIRDERTNLIAERKVLRERVTVAVMACSTDARLRVDWPEATALLPPPKKPTVGLLATTVSNLNAALGLVDAAQVVAAIS